MALNLRQAIIERVHDKTEVELADIIESAIGAEEQALPGIGVLFEIIWQQSDASLRQQMLSTLRKQLQTTEPPTVSSP